MRVQLKTTSRYPILLLLLLMVMFPNTLLVAQNLSPEPVMPTADSWAFMKYGNTPIDHYTGTIQQQIPIYTYQDEDFDIPISLGYASSGLLTNSQTGILGLGWYLNAGGMISVDVKGIPDFKRIPGVTPQLVLPIGGYWHYHIDSNTPETEEPLNNFSCINDVMGFSTKKGFFETTSDVYNFNFFGHTGSFIMDGKSIKVFNTNRPKNEYRISMSLNGTYAQIKITTGDGYTYVFGGDTHESDPCEAVYDIAEDGARFSHNNIIKLSTIIAPNGRKALFYYSNNPENLHNDGSHIVTNVRPKPDVHLNQTYLNSTPFDVFGNSGIYHWEYLRPVYLDSIVIENRTSVIFEYKSRNNIKEIFRNELTNKSYEYEGQKYLEKIEVKSKQTSHTVKKADLSYSYTPTNGNRILLLKKLQISGEGNYNMSYYNEDSLFPYLGTFQCDHWGYYNGVNNSYTSFIPDIAIDELGNETILGTSRNPKPDRAKYGMLKKLEYPTGGWTNFEYGPHIYSSAVVRENDPIYGMAPKLKKLDSDKIAGGLRIEKIIDYYSKDDSLVRSFIYETDSQSDGILLHYPRYYYQLKITGHEILYSGNMFEDHFVFQGIWNYAKISSTNLGAYSMDNTHIEYGKVTEIRPDKSSIERQFYTYNEYPDLPYFEAHAFKQTTSGHILANDDLTARMACLDIEPSSASIMRGKPSGVTYKNVDRRPIYSETYEYEYTPLWRKLYRVGRVITYIGGYDISDHPIIRTHKTNYLSQGIFHTEEEYAYNDFGQLKEQKTMIEDGYSSVINSYVTDISDSQRTDVEKKMVEKNIISNPLKVSRVEYKDRRRGTISKEKYNYKESQGLVVLNSISKALIQDPFSTGPFNYKQGTTYDIYDGQGKILQTTDPSGVSTSYIWGYGGRYLLAAVVGISASELNSVPGLAGIQSNYHNGLSEDQIDQLYKLEGCQVTVLDHIPELGMSEKIDPSGRKETYYYDNHGRLLMIIDDKGKVTDSFNYHLKQ